MLLRPFLPLFGVDSVRLAEPYDGLADFFSKPHDSPLASDTMAGASKEREPTKSAARDEEGARAGKGESMSPFDRLDSLDDDALADLDEDSVGEGDAVKSTREATSEVPLEGRRPARHQQARHAARLPATGTAAQTSRHASLGRQSQARRATHWRPTDVRLGGGR